jgi:hypothetical protein
MFMDTGCNDFSCWGCLNMTIKTLFENDQTKVTRYHESIDILTGDKNGFGTFQTIELTDMGDTITISPSFLVGTGKYAHTDKITISIIGGV